jgi:hypothetical protein
LRYRGAQSRCGDAEHAVVKSSHAAVVHRHATEAHDRATEVRDHATEASHHAAEASHHAAEGHRCVHSDWNPAPRHRPCAGALVLAEQLAAENERDEPAALFFACSACSRAFFPEASNVVPHVARRCKTRGARGGERCPVARKRPTRGSKGPPTENAGAPFTFPASSCGIRVTRWQLSRCPRRSPAARRDRSRGY